MQVKRHISDSTRYAAFHVVKVKNFCRVSYNCLVSHREKYRIFPANALNSMLSRCLFPWHSWCKSRTKQTACESHERISLTHFRYGISQQRRVS